MTTFYDYFPYSSFRDQQEKVISDLFNGLSNKKNILFIAPNGAGKTVDTLTAALPIAMDNDLKILYLCRTHQQNARVIEEIQKINQKLSEKQRSINESNPDSNPLIRRISAVSIRGRNEMCLHRTIKKMKGSPSDAMNICANLRKNKNCSYFNKMIQNKTILNDDLKSIAKSCIDAQDLIKYCEVKQYCPYFFTKLLVKEVIVIACNYQWVFNPSIRDAFLEGAHFDLEKCIIIMDECHNLPEMAAEIDSERLTLYSVRQAVKDLKLGKALDIMVKRVEVWENIFDFFKKKIKDEEIELDPIAILQNYMKQGGFKDQKEIENFINDLDEYGKAVYDEKISSGGNPIDFIGIIVTFLNKFLLCMKDKRYFFTAVPNVQKSGEKNVFIDIICLDPREITKAIYGQSYGTISCSGTIQPDSFIVLTGLNQLLKSSVTIQIKSPFPKRNIKVIVTQGINTKAENRFDPMYKQMLSIITEVIFKTPANVGIFCASYKVLEGLISSGLSDIVRFAGKKLYIENSEHSASENAEMIQNYKADSEKSGAVLLGVSGGRNSEGEDFPGNYMNSVVVAGFPFQRPSVRIEAKIRYYDSIFNQKGRLYAYIIPAVQKANQAAGRPIRKMDDRGVIILMDDRFLNMSNFLSSWLCENMEVFPNDPQLISEAIQEFFSK